MRVVDHPERSEGEQECSPSESAPFVPPCRPDAFAADSVAYTPAMRFVDLTASPWSPVGRNSSPMYPA